MIVDPVNQLFIDVSNEYYNVTRAFMLKIRYNWMLCMQTSGLFTAWLEKRAKLLYKVLSINRSFEKTFISSLVSNIANMRKNQEVCGFSSSFNLTYFTLGYACSVVVHCTDPQIRICIAKNLQKIISASTAANRTTGDNTNSRQLTIDCKDGIRRFIQSYVRNDTDISGGVEELKILIKYILES